MALYHVGYYETDNKKAISPFFLICPIIIQIMLNIIHCIRFCHSMQGC